MTDYTRYNRENEDLEGDYDSDATWCEDCDKELSMDEVICKACEAKRESYK